jgi:hypothetical protein
MKCVEVVDEIVLEDGINGVSGRCIALLHQPVLSMLTSESSRGNGKYAPFIKYIAPRQCLYLCLLLHRVSERVF